jgi:hypothetical protein
VSDGLAASAHETTVDSVTTCCGPLCNDGAVTIGRHRGSRYLGRSVALVALTVSVVAACAEPEDQSLCPAFEEFLGTRAAVRALDPSDLTAGEATDLVESYLQRITRMQEVADGRYTSELDALESAVDDVVRTLASVQDAGDYDTWQPLVEDSLEDVQDASARFVEAVEPSCFPDVTEG